MKRLVFLVLLVAMVATVALVASEGYQFPRFNGTSTPATDDIWVVMDSTDTFQVDTFLSDVVTLDACDDRLAYALYLAGWTEADSANDSVVIFVNLQSRYASEPYRTIATDTFATALDSTEVLTRILNIDTTTIGSNVRFQTVVKDSFISAGAGSNVDSNRYELRYYVKTSQTAYEGDCD